MSFSSPTGTSYLFPIALILKNDSGLSDKLSLGLGLFELLDFYKGREGFCFFQTSDQCLKQLGLIFVLLNFFFVK